MKLEVLSALLVALLAVQTNAQGDFMMDMYLMRALAGGGNSGSSYSPPSSYPTAGVSKPATGSGAASTGATPSPNAVGYGLSRGRGHGGLFGGGMGPMMALSGGMGDFMTDYMMCRMYGMTQQMRQMCMLRNL